MAKTITRVKSKGLLLLNISVAVYLFATGVMGILGKRGSEIRKAVYELFERGTGDFARVLTIIISVLAIVAGIFILVKLFGVSINYTEILLIILAVTWLVFILLMDIIYPINNRDIEILDWLRGIGSHAMVLAAIVMGTNKFGIK